MSAEKSSFTASEESRDKIGNDRIDIVDMPKEVLSPLNSKPSLEILEMLFILNRNVFILNINNIETYSP